MARKLSKSLEVDVVQVSEVDPVKKIQGSSTKRGILGIVVGTREPMEGWAPDI